MAFRLACAVQVLAVSRLRAHNNVDTAAAGGERYGTGGHLAASQRGGFAPFTALAQR